MFNLLENFKSPEPGSQLINTVGTRAESKRVNPISDCFFQFQLYSRGVNESITWLEKFILLLRKKQSQNLV
jgi:hypothetical protein